ncbi:hypothetical protein [Occallatibacter savannae]|uniref:hypothetical protein n=1 Tax=Occallatibacter savannae TaxID=1002691 RepID=UPI000D69BB85|nr:hypothetical protein [Occallatibacter savannae]
MTNLSRSLSLLARGALEASKKRRQISVFLKKQGFISLGKGGWLGFRNRDIVSGFVIEGSPLDTYISTFVLPAFDRHTFVSWCLGDRLVHCSFDRDSQEECEQAVNSYAADISKIKSATELAAHLDAGQIGGHYPIWVRFICYLRRADIDSAIQYLTDGRRNEFPPSIIERAEEVSGFVTMRDTDGVARVLESWSAFSEKIFGPLEQTFSA